MTRVLGINRTSDASACVLDGNDGLTLLRKERLSRKKHAWGSLGDIELYRTSSADFEGAFDAIVECYSSDRERVSLQTYRNELAAQLNLSPETRFLEISHHFSHAYAAFFPSGFAEAAVLIADNRGSPSDLMTDRPAVNPDGNGEGPLEVISLFQASLSGIRPLEKQYWDRSVASPCGLGMFYSVASKAALGVGEREGVLMGLAAHGNHRQFSLPPLDVRGAQVTIPPEWLEVLLQQGRFAPFEQGGAALSEVANFAARVQFAFEEALIAVARHARELTGSRDLVYAGGCALNCSANARLLEESGFERIFVPPACDDGGSAIGCALYGLEQVGGDPSLWRWTSDYLGQIPNLEFDALADVAQALGLVIEQPENLSQTAAQALAGGEIVALFQGRSEAGPRALGNRSILALPTSAAVRDFVNSEVKYREWFRPLAPVVREESADIYFDLDGPSPFMQRRVMVRPEWADRLAGVCHVDGSARVQTVTRAQNPFLYELLGEFHKLLEVDVLLNTSFNGNEEPIVETLTQACQSLRNMKIDRLLAPPYQILKKNV